MSKTTDTTPAQTGATTELAAAKPAGVINIVRAKIQSLANSGQIVFPEDYSAENALVAAQLQLLRVENMDKKRILDQSGRPTGVVTEASIVNAVTQMLTEGMNITKGQGSFIVYKDELAWQREYPGDIAFAKRVDPGIEFYYETIRAGEDIVTERKWSTEAGFVDVVTEHKKPFPRSPELIGAYCGVFRLATQEPVLLVLFDMDRIRKSWGMSRNQNNNKLQQVFTDIACLRTVIRRAATTIISKSDDSALLAAYNKGNIERAEFAIDAEIAEHANGQIITMPSSLPAAEEPESPKAPAPVASAAASPASAATEGQATSGTTQPTEDPRETARRMKIGTYTDAEGVKRSTMTGNPVSSPQPVVEPEQLDMEEY